MRRLQNRSKTAFWESGNINDATYMHYFRKLTELSTTIYEWYNVPDGIDVRYLELALFTDGMAVLFYDEDMEEFLGLRAMVNGTWNVYNVPNKRRAYASNGYNRNLNIKNSVMVYNNYLRTPTKYDVELYAQRLWDLDRTIDINAKAQKTPIVIACPENTRLSFLNIFKKWSGNEPLIIADPRIDLGQIKTLNTSAPFVADKLYTLKTNVWNEALESIGVPNLQNEKKERMVDREITSVQGATIANRFSGLEMRKMACDKFNKLFGKNMGVKFRDDIDLAFKDVKEEKIEEKVEEK
jgi:hypothetical protein